jgi:hypothetical protein
MTHRNLLLVLLVGAMSGCMSFEVVSSTRTKETLSATKVATLHAKRLRSKSAATHHIELEQSGTRHYDLLTYHTPRVEYKYKSMVKKVWDWHFPQAIPLIKILLTVPALPADALSWLVSAPAAYIGGSSADIAPYEVATTPTKSFREPLADGTRLTLTPAQGTEQPIVVKSSRVELAFAPIAKHFLQQGTEQPAVTLQLEHSADARAQVKFTLTEVTAAVQTTIQGDDATQLASWLSIYNQCPASATKVRKAIDSYVQPIQRRENHRLAEIARLEELRRKREARRIQIAKEKAEREAREERARIAREKREAEERRLAEERRIARAAQREKERIAHEKLMVEVRKENKVQIPKMENELAALKKTATHSKEDLRSVLTLERKLANSLRLGRYASYEPQAKTDLRAALKGFARVARIASELDDLSVLEEMILSMKRTKKELGQ